MTRPFGLKRPPLHRHTSIVIRYNYYGDGMYDALSVGCDTVECKGRTRHEALTALEAEIEKRLPEYNND